MFGRAVISVSFVVTIEQMRSEIQVLARMSELKSRNGHLQLAGKKWIRKQSMRVHSLSTAKTQVTDDR
jgi:hypothetical protein